MHKPVLLNEILANLRLLPNEIFIDGTLGGAGHSLAICQKYPAVSIIGFELDPKARELANQKLSEGDCNFKIIPDNFRNLEKSGMKEVAAVLFDLGLSSIELASSGRGFSFQKNEPLLMTFGEPDEYVATAKDIVNEWREENLEMILRGYGEERYARRIAKSIVEEREKKPIATTTDLVQVIEKAVPANYKNRKIHFATKTFQAIRIAVNDELKVLTEALPKAFDLLKPGGRLLVISFHSLEDRIVKRFFREKKKTGVAEIITKKPIRTGEEEIGENPRARSAKLRILEKLKYETI